MKKTDLSFLDTICEAMTDDIKMNFEKLFIVARKDKEKKYEIMEKLNNRIHFTIDKRKIHWYPYIDYKKCASCKKCINFCKKGVYSFNKDKKIVEVKNIENCTFLCKDCESLCENQAIVLPKRKDMLDYFYFE